MIRFSGVINYAIIEVIMLALAIIELFFSLKLCK